MGVFYREIYKKKQIEKNVKSDRMASDTYINLHVTLRFNAQNYKSESVCQDIANDVTDLKPSEMLYQHPRSLKLHMTCQSEPCGFQSLRVTVGSGQLTLLSTGPHHTALCQLCEHQVIPLSVLRSLPAQTISFFTSAFLCIQIIASSEGNIYNGLKQKELKSPEGHDHTSGDTEFIMHEYEIIITCFSDLLLSL